ncbi:hypothetical protein L0F63_001725 [Massospora cicadina]|nr:hypothetical protein L0F63_001725 [Massospora cicadina]
MLFFMEHELQAVGPTVTIPYWDWTSYSHDPWNDVALSNRMFGNQRIQKRLRSGCARAIDRNYLNEPNIARFAEAIELVPHATTRNNIGGEFAGHTSPGDPLFIRTTRSSISCGSIGKTVTVKIVSPPLNATDDELMLHAKNFILKGLNNQTIFNPLPIDFIRTMGYDQAKVRQLERRDPVLIASRGDKF